MNTSFENVKKHFGFGCMRLPMKDGEVDRKEMCQMVDIFLENGFNYFDTAHGYLGGKSETALRKCLTSRYPREQYILTNKLTNFFFKKQETGASCTHDFDGVCIIKLHGWLLLECYVAGCDYDFPNCCYGAGAFD